VAEPIRIGIVGARFAAKFHRTGFQRVYGPQISVGQFIRSGEPLKRDPGRDLKRISLDCVRVGTFFDQLDP
jgi:hypothetical protein